MLIFLLIASSSQAAEIVTHDSHGHGSTYERTVLHGLDSPAHPEKSTHNHSPSHNQPESADGQNEDCFCADICCFSSVDLGVPLTAGASPQVNLPSGKPVSLYQSVSLDLFLPPPTL